MHYFNTYKVYLSIICYIILGTSAVNYGYFLRGVYLINFWGDCLTGISLNNDTYANFGLLTFR